MVTFAKGVSVWQQGSSWVVEVSGGGKAPLYCCATRPMAERFVSLFQVACDVLDIAA